MLDDNREHRHVELVEWEQSLVEIVSTPEEYLEINFSNWFLCMDCNSQFTYFRSTTKWWESYTGTSVSISGQTDFREFRLFYANVIITMQTLATEIFWPVGILIVENQQIKTSVFIEYWPSCTGNSSSLKLIRVSIGLTISKCITNGTYQWSMHLDLLPHQLNSERVAIDFHVIWLD